MTAVPDIERSFIEHLSSLGIAPASDADVRADGKKRRYRIEGDKPRERNGEYCLYADEHPAGWAKSYSAKHGVEYSTWSAGKNGADAGDFNQAYFEERERRRQEKAAEERRKLKHGARSANAAIRTMTQPRKDHPYIRRKGLSFPLPSGVGQIGSDLIVPLRDAKGEIWNRQAISPDGTKMFLPGRKAGCYFEIEGDGDVVYVVEGLATGITVHEATGKRVVVAFDAGNIRRVVEALASVYAGRMVIAADNDRRTPGNPGMKAALDTGVEFEIPVVSPDFSPEENGNDWNDFALTHGIEKAADEITRQTGEWFKEIESRSPVVPWPDVDNKGNPLKTIGNVRAMLRHLGCTVWYDLVKKQPRYNVPGTTFCCDNRDNAFLAHLLSECHKHHFKIDKTMMDLYLFEIQDGYRRHPVREWIVSRTWDGTDRFRALADTLRLDEGFPPSLRDLLLRRWLVSCVAAAFAGDDENLQFRGVLVLQGEQAIGKSLWLRSLTPDGSDWFLGGLTLDVKDKDSVIKAISHWIVELGELDATFKAQDVSRLKQFITQGDDTLRLPYAPKPATYKRRTVYCASVNPGYFLADSTGNTRWWTVPVRECRFDHGIDMQQLWAQVRSWYASGERHWLDKEETMLLEQHNADSAKSDPVEDLLSRLFDWDEYEDAVASGQVEWLTATEVLLKCKGMDHPTKQQVDVAAQALRKLTGRKAERKGKACSRCYLVPKFARLEEAGFSFRR
jgi:putative DNA primase/helicase